MTRAELEAAAKEKYPTAYDRIWGARAAYIQGRLDQAEADAQIAEGFDRGNVTEHFKALDRQAQRIAAEIRKGAE